MALEDDYRRCLFEIDVAGVMALHRHFNPHLPQPSPAEALVAVHIARTMMKTISARARKYSEDWLAERAALPGKPVVAEAVAIGVKSSDEGLKDALEGGMTRTVMRALADGVAASDAGTLRPLIWDAHEKIKRGRTSI